MKKVYIISLLLCSFLGISQEITKQDALRYSVDNLNGTARFRAMSGAFGAVGGDLSAININPAGSAIFNNNMASITASSFNNTNKSNYFGTQTTENFSILDLNQLGVVFVFTDANGENNWKKFTIALNYENQNNLDNRLFSAGRNPNSSIAEYFLYHANTGLNNSQPVPLQYTTRQLGESITDLYSFLGSNFPNNQLALSGFSAQQAMLAYYGQTYIIDALDTNDPNSSYVSNVPAGANYFQQNYISATGYNGKFSGNFATSYKDILFLGMNLNAHFTDYAKNARVSETNDSNAANRVESIQFNNDLYTYGAGFSFNLGAIVQATKELRVGLAYESPTWYRLNDELRQTLLANNYENGSPIPTGIDIASPDVTNIYPTYKLQTAQKITGSASYVFNKKGLISIDAAMKDYTTTQFSPVNEAPYQSVNIDLNNSLQSALELRIGGEYRIKQVSLRGGYRFEESPYKVDLTMGDLIGYSGGIGYNFGDSKLDLAYSNSHRNYNQSLVSSGMNDTARIRTVQNNVTLTYSINF